LTPSGSVAEGWEGVAQAFGRTVDDDAGAGAALCVYLDGACVLDVWGGNRGPDGAAWEAATAACLFSATKGVAAICVHMLAQRGLVDLDAPVAKYWPEFGTNGKDDVPVRWVLTHQAGLPSLDVDLTLHDVAAL
jgi:CubicO group peptidase (beta-lactamase class C family)